MKRMTRWLMACAAVTVLVSGCSTTNAKDGSSAAGEQPAVMCGKCETTWVRSPHTINKTTVYRSNKRMDCPDCDSAALTFLKTGKFEHSCKICGDSLTTCPACK